MTVIEKTIQQSSSNSYWILALMILGGIGLYYYNPRINLDEILEPVLDKIDANIPSNYIMTFVTGTFIYKTITISISYFTGYDLNIFKGDDDSLNDEDKINIKEIFNNYKGKSRYSPISSLNNEDKVEYESYFPKHDDEEDINTPKASSSKLPETYIITPQHTETQPDSFIPYSKVKESD